jgi:hypothetical protein
MARRSSGGTVIGRFADWLEHFRRDLISTDRPAGELSRGDDPFDRGLFRKNLVSSRWWHVVIRPWRFRGPPSRIAAGQGFGLALGGLKVRVPLSREPREVSAPLVLDVYLKANLARPIAIRASTNRRSAPGYPKPGASRDGRRSG